MDVLFLEYCPNPLDLSLRQPVRKIMGSVFLIPLRSVFQAKDPPFLCRLTLSLRIESRVLSTFRGVDIEPLVTSSFLTSPDCFDKQLTQQGQINPHVCVHF